MTKLLEQAIEQVRRLPEHRQDAIARQWLEQAEAAPEGTVNGETADPAQVAEEFRRSLKALARRATPPPADWKFNRGEAYEERLGDWG